MNPLRKVALVLAATFLPLALWSAGVSWSIHGVFGTPRHLEGALQTSGLYSTVVSDVLAKAQTDQTNQGTGTTTVPTSQPQIQAIIKQAFPPQFLQTQTNQVLDAVYAWLQGKQPALAFTIDLGSAKQQLANGVQQYAQTRLSRLPICTNNQIPTGDVDPFSAACIPKGVDVTAVATKARDDILNGGFLKDTKLTADNLKTGDGQPLSQKLHNAPTAYRRSTVAMYALLVLAVLLTAAVVLLSSTWRSGLRKVAITYMSVGAIMVVFAWTIVFGLHRAIDAIGATKSSNKELEQSILRVVELVGRDLRSYWLAYGITLLGLGIAGLVVGMVMSGRKQGTAPANESAGRANPAQPSAQKTATPSTSNGRASEPNAAPSKDGKE
ncbi:MAG TPA: hypothetical protein VJP80_07735 [Candidatus Saccharimonadales bacterium]|nr:hypothetical protein [Candidatus Saccharimonadales bacterium]